MKPIAALATIFAACLALQPSHAHAACHFSTDLPIVCTGGLAAVLAERKFGDDDAAIRQSYNQQILHSAGCGTPYNASTWKHSIELVNKGRVATDTGWVPVSIISVDGKDLWYIASSYVFGVCKKYNHVTGQ